MPIGYFDYLILGILIFLNFKFWKREISEGIGCIIIIVVGLLFGFLLPYISSYIEVQKAEISFANFDSADLIYNLFIYPVYWLVGIIQTIITGKKAIRKKTDKNNGTDRIE